MLRRSISTLVALALATGLTGCWSQMDRMDTPGGGGGGIVDTDGDGFADEADDDDDGDGVVDEQDNAPVTPGVFPEE